MSISGSQSGIVFGGLSSGLDTESIIQRLVQLQQVPISRMQQTQSELQSKQQLYSGLQGQVNALQTAANALNNLNTFQAVTASTSDSTVATITNTSANTAGTYALSVTQLAQANKISSDAKADLTSALNLSGNFIVNGKNVSISGVDSLTSIAQKINSVNSGVTASVINGGANKAYITLTSGTTGKDASISLADQTGGVLSSLGLITGPEKVRNAITNGAKGIFLNDSSTAVGTQLGTTGTGAQVVQINGTNVNINLDTDSLTTIAANINAANTGATATVVSSTDANNLTTYGLQITGNGSTPTFTDSNNTLSALGILQSDAKTQLVAGQDAQFSLDGLSLTSATNTVTSAVPGATITLLKGNTLVNNVNTASTATLTLTQDSSGIQNKVQAFADAYNAVRSYISQNSTFDTKTFQAGGLFGDPTAQQVESDILDRVFKTIPGGTGTLSNLANIGFSLDKDDNLTVDKTALSKAIANNPQQVANLFKATGISDSAQLTYVTSSSKSVSSDTGKYAVNITQAATQGSTTASVAQSGGLGQAETITFAGGVFGTSPYSITLAQGSTQAQIIAQINSDSKLKTLVSASSVGGKLQIASQTYGSKNNFTVTSNLAADATNSGIGTAGQATVVAGLDVAGTINGEAATGNGQFLTGNSGNATTDGLSIQYSGATTGAIGSMQFNRGVAGIIGDLVTGYDDTTNGLFTASNNSLQTQIDDITTQVTDLTSRLDTYTQDLRQKFANMETAIQNFHNQASQLSSVLH